MNCVYAPPWPNPAPDTSTPAPHPDGLPPRELNIALGLAADDITDAAALYWRAFGADILPFAPQGGARLVASGVDPRMVLAARLGGKLVGIAGLRDAHGGFLDLPCTDFRAAFGPFGQVLRILTRLYRAGPVSPDMILDGLVVDPAFRACGIGRALVRAALTEAGARGYPGLRAEVAAGNAPALNLYHALGFGEIGRARIGWPWSLSPAARIMQMAVPPVREPEGR